MLFRSLMADKSVICLYDFENKAPVFPDVHRSFKFCTLVFGGAQEKAAQAEFVFFARRMDDLAEKRWSPRKSAVEVWLKILREGAFESGQSTAAAGLSGSSANIKPPISNRSL